MTTLKSPSAMKNTGIEARCAATGMRMTEQRRVIARVLADSADHPDVEELYRGRVGAQLLLDHPLHPRRGVFSEEKQGPGYAPLPRPAFRPQSPDEKQLPSLLHQSERGDVCELLWLGAVWLRDQSRDLRRTHSLRGARTRI